MTEYIEQLRKADGERVERMQFEAKPDNRAALEFLSRLRDPTPIIMAAG